MEANRDDINAAASTLRQLIDYRHATALDEYGSHRVADEETKPLYDAVTLLHEQAMKSVAR